MYSSVFVVVLSVAGAVLCQEGYKTSFQNVDLDEILNNDRLYTNYLKCLTGEGKCTPEGKELKDILPDALASGCSKCNEKQKAGAEKVIKFLIANKAEDYAALEKIYDPQGTFKTKFQAEAKRLGLPA